MPTRLPNLQYRSREHLTFTEVKRLIDAASLRGRHPVRDKALILLMFRHGLRAGEACSLRWDAVMIPERSIAITRLKNSLSGVHRLQSDEIEVLTELRARYPDSFHLFINERGNLLTVDRVDKIIKEAGKLAGLPMPVHSHMLRHSCGYYLADQGQPTRNIQEYLGHSNIQNTVKYTAGNPARYDNIDWGVGS